MLNKLNYLNCLIDYGKDFEEKKDRRTHISVHIDTCMTYGFRGREHAYIYLPHVD